MKLNGKIDLHMHTTVSDGTDSPQEIIAKVKDAGIVFFSVTDHDAIKGGKIIPPLLQEGDPQFITGVEFSCKDEEGQYHILGYNYDPDSPSIQEVVDLGHRYRMQKLQERLDFLQDEFGFVFPKEELDQLFAMDNPGKPHIGNMMVRCGYAETKEKAIKEYINKKRFLDEYVRPEEAIEGILKAGGVPVLAHPAYGSGDQLILGEVMDHRLRKLIGFGLEGIEAFYSGFPEKIHASMMKFAETYNLYVTAGSDYHGRNKIISLADNGMDEIEEYPEGMVRFMKRVGII